ncbi:hypothetical protein LOK74_06895 [Brevibacillus humidisoli]|uniref:YkvI family membrane protein n=1 Tax=Brevibacillus humidisoli TaxID=2895522 RepID=UPI001E4AEB0D|nr:hypothetical protein [Brevibacillus humidisoli]UFJ42217.1 hypothetical protein LOK74_06895 [Brevibacillus humidisoli]
MVKSWKQSLQIAFTYIGTVVGAGFASGREIIEFFVQYGTQGLIGIFLASLLFIWAGVRVMILAYRLQASSYQEINNYLFGKTAGSLFNLILLAVLLGTTSVMLAATGALFAGSFHLPAQVGIWFSMIWIFLVTAKGLQAIHSVNSLFVPVLIGFTVLVFLYSEPWNAASTSTAVVETNKPWIWFTSPFYYVALNVSLTQAVLVPIGRASKSEHPLILGGLLGGLGIGLLLLLAYSSMSAHMPQIVSMEMPMIYMLAGLGQGAALLFALLVYAEIFSTLVANVFGIVQQLKQVVSLPPPLIILVILLACYLVSFIGFIPLLSLLYPLFGQIVVLFLFMLCYRQIETFVWKK